jgi:prolyl-tRNA synthetase
LIETLNDKKGFVSCFWDEDKENEIKVKEKTSATLRCYPINNDEVEKSVNNPNKNGRFAIFSKAY